MNFLYDLIRKRRPSASWSQNQ